MQRSRCPALRIGDTTVGSSSVPACTTTKNGSSPDVSQLTLTELTNFIPHRVYQGPTTLEFFDSPQDHYADIPVREVVEGFYYSSDFTLEDGDVIHDISGVRYLDERYCTISCNVFHLLAT